MNGWLRFVGVVAVCLSVVAGASVALADPPVPSEAPEAAGNGPYTPPTCVPGVPFSDITCTTGFDPWIEQFGLDGITAGCGGGLYCPGTPVTRDQMAVFIEKSMRGTANWPPRVSRVSAVLNADGSPNWTASGDQLRSALLAIPSAGPAAPTSANHWLVKVGPGLYDLGTVGATLYPYVDLEGSGIFTTTITSAVTSGFTIGTVTCMGSSKITDVSISNIGGTGAARAIGSLSGKLILNKARAWAGLGSTDNAAITVWDGALDMQESEAWALGTNAIALDLHGTPSSAYAEIRNSYLLGTYTIWNNTTATVRMATSRISGTLHPNTSGGHYSCFANFNDDMSSGVGCPVP